MKSADIKSVAGFAIACAAVCAALSIPVLPKHWVALAIAIVSLGIAGYQVHRARFEPPSSHEAPHWLFLLFGFAGIGLAYGMWVSPPTTPTLSMWLGMLTGVALGGILLWASRERKNA